MADNVTAKDASNATVVFASKDYSGVQTPRLIIDNLLTGTFNIGGSLPAGGNAIGSVTITSISAGSNAIGKLALNDGVDIGDVTVNNAAGASAVNIQDGGNSITVDGFVAVTGTVNIGSALPAGANSIGQVTANAGTNLNTSALALEAGNLATIAGWNQTNRAAVNLITGSVGVQGGSGVATPNTQRVVLATDIALPTGANVIGQVTANAGTNLNTSALALEAGNLATIAGWNQTNRGAVNLVTGSAGVQGGSGVVTVNTLRVTMATDVALPTGANAIGKLALNDGIDIGDVTNNNAGGASAVNIQDGGNSITVDGFVSITGTVTISGGGAGGTAVTDASVYITGTTNETPIGGTFRIPRAPVANGTTATFAMTQTRAQITAIETASGTSAMDETNAALRVNVVAGGAGDGSILDGVSSSIKATVFSYTNSKPLSVRLTDTNGDYIAAGAGTQYTQNVAGAATPIGTALNLIRDDSLAGGITDANGKNISARGNNKGEQYVKHTDMIVITGTASVIANAGTNLNTSLLALESGNIATVATKISGWDQSSRAAVNLITGSAGVQGGSGVVTVNTLRVTLATDIALPTGANVIGQVTANAGTNLNTSALALEAGNLATIAGWNQTNRAAVNLITGSAGVQGASGVVTTNTLRVTLATDVALPTGANVIGQVTANAGTNLNTSALALEAGNLATIAGWNQTARAAVNPISGQVGVQGASGVVTALTQRVVLATDIGLPAGANAIGSVSVSNAAGASAVNIQDGGNSITVDGFVYTTGTVYVANGLGASAVNIQDGNNSITVDGIVSLSSGTNPIGTVRFDSNNISDGSILITPQFVLITGQASGNTTIITGTANKRIRVLNYTIISNGTVNVKFQDGTGGLDLTGPIYCVANVGASPAFSPYGQFQTTVGNALILNLSASIAVGGHLTYILV